MSSAARSRWFLALILVVAIVVVWRMRRAPRQASSVAYVSDPTAMLWSTTAQVRHPVAEVGYGDQVVVLQRAGDQAEVRTADGVQGWVDAHMLMDPELWQRGAALASLAHTLPVQAIGHTRTISNVHLEPGRDSPRIFQFGRNVPVAVLERKVMPVPAAGSADGASGEETTPVSREGDSNKPKMEDWLFIWHTPGSSSDAGQSSVVASVKTDSGEVRDVPVAGWVLGRFLDLDAPPPIPDYSTAEGMRVVAWAVLNTVPDPSGDKPQYVVAGTRVPEGDPCDFTTLRVFTWGTARQRYETAYVGNDVCGMMPIRVSQTASGSEFRFAQGGVPPGEPSAEFVYSMKDTIVRRVSGTEAAPRKRRR